MSIISISHLLGMEPEPSLAKFSEYSTVLFSGKCLNRQLLMSADTVGGVKSLFCCCTLDAEQRWLTGPCAADAGVNLVRIWDTSHRTDRKDFLNSWQSHSWRPTASRLSAPAVQMACVRNVSYAGHRSQKSRRANKYCGVIPGKPLTSVLKTECITSETL